MLIFFNGWPLFFVTSEQQRDRGLDGCDLGEQSFAGGIVFRAARGNRKDHSPSSRVSCGLAPTRSTARGFAVVLYRYDGSQLQGKIQMNKALQFSLGVCAVVALSVVAEARPKKENCIEISGSGSGIFQDMAKNIAKDNLDQKIENLKQKAGKVTVKGDVKSTCSGFDCKVSRRVCGPSIQRDCEPEDCP
jgi:hypothetical protein